MSLHTLKEEALAEWREYSKGEIVDPIPFLLSQIEKSFKAGRNDTTVQFGPIKEI